MSSKIYVRYLTGSIGFIPIKVCATFEEACGVGMVFCYDISNLGMLIAMFIVAMRRLDLREAL